MLNRASALPGILIFAMAGSLAPMSLGASAPQDPQIIRGSVADASTLEVIPGATVTLVADGTLTQTGLDGRFEFTGTPSGPTSLQIEAPGYQTTLWIGEITADRIEPVEIFLAEPQAPGTVRVVVRADESGEPLAGVAVHIPELGITVATDEDGAVVISDVPQGSFPITVTSLGYATLSTPVEFDDPSIALEVSLRSEPIGLEAVVVEGQAGVINGALDRAGFYQRRAQGLGIFFDRVEIERENPRIPSDLIRGLPGVQSRQVGTSNYAISNRRGFAGFDTLMVINDQAMGYDCRMQVFVDGAAFGAPRPMSRDSNGRLSGDDGVLDMIPLESIEALEVISAVSRLPMQYNVANANCGVILVWTRNFSVASPSGPATPISPLAREVQLGDQVRITSEVASGQFRVAEAGPNGLTLRTDSASESIEVPASAITGLEVRLGRSLSSGRGLILGGVTGALGGVVALVVCHMPHFEHYGCIGDLSPETSAAMSVGLGAAVGLVVSWMTGDVWGGGRLPQ